MKSKMITTIAAGLAIAGSAVADSSFSADFASAYVFRGSTFNDGAVFQPGIEVAGLGLSTNAGALAVGAWGNFDIDAPAPGAASSEFTEIDWYAAYSLPTIIDGIDLSIGYTEYTYMDPVGAGGAPSDKEASIGASTEVAGASLGITGFFMVGGEFHGQVYVDFSASYAVEVSEDLSVEAGANVGYIKQGADVVGYSLGGAEDGLNDGSLSISASYVLNDVWSIGISGAYIAQLDDEVLADVDDPVSPGGYDVDFVGVLSLGASF